MPVEAPVSNLPEFEGASPDPFGDLIPKSGDLESLTPNLDQYGPFHDLVKADTPAPEASMAYDNLVGGGTKDAEAYQQRPSGNFEHVPRGVAVSTTDLGPFTDLAGKGRETPITNYDDQFGVFADMVPRSPAPEVDRQAQRASFRPKTGSVEDYLVARERSIVAGGDVQEPARKPSLLTSLAAQERERVIKQSRANYRGEEISAPQDIRKEQLSAAPGGETFDLSSQGPISAAVAGAGHSAILSLGDIVKGSAGLALQHPGLREDANAKDKMDFINSSQDPFLQWARQTPQLAEKVFPVNPQEKAAGAIGEAVGSFAPLLAAGPFGAFVIAMQGAGQKISSDYNARLEAGENPEKAARATFRNATLGALSDEAVWGVLPHPLRVAGDKYLIEKFGTDGLKRFLASRVAQGTEGAVLGAATRIAQNTATGDNLLEGVTQSATGLGVLQAFLPRGGSLETKESKGVAKQPEGARSKFEELPKTGLEEETTPEAPKIPPSLNPLTPETPKEEAPLKPRDIGTALVDDEGNILEQSPIGQAKTHEQLFEQAKGKPHEEAALNAFADDSRHIFVDKNGNQLSRGNLKDLFGFEHSADLIEAQKLQVRDELRKRSSEYQQKKADAIAETMKAAGDSGGVEMVSNTQPDRKLIISPDPAEPGKWRVTKIDKDGPYGHHLFDSREAALAAASGDSGSELVKGPHYFTLGDFKVTRVRPTVETTPPEVPEPPKNENGVYDPGENQAEVLEYKPSSKSNRENAKIRILQIGPDKWISATDYSTPIEGRSGPLSVNSKVFPTRDAALEDAAGELSGHFERGLQRTDANPTELKRLTRLKAWTDDILLRQKGKAHLDKLISDARQKPTPKTEPPPETPSQPEAKTPGITQEHVALLPEKTKVQVELDDFDPDGNPITITRKMNARKAAELLLERAKSMQDFLDCL